jgi:hypothetical protein
LRQLIDEIRATNPAAMPQIAAWWLTCALAERDVAAAREALLAFDEGPLGVDAVHFPRPSWKALSPEWQMTSKRRNWLLLLRAWSRRK